MPDHGHHSRRGKGRDLDGGRGAHSWQRLSTTELRSRQVAILDAVHRHCRDLGITYYLCAGTLLGAVRHQGYTSWDDDIDIMVPRHDYEKFIRTFPSPDSTDRYSIRSLETSPSYPFPFAKVCDDRTRLIVGSDVVRDLGVYVDVFPVDGWCERRLAGMLQKTALHVTFAAMRAKHLQTKTARTQSGGRCSRWRRLRCGRSVFAR